RAPARRTRARLARGPSSRRERKAGGVLSPLLRPQHVRRRRRRPALYHDGLLAGARRSLRAGLGRGAALVDSWRLRQGPDAADSALIAAISSRSSCAAWNPTN